MCDLKTSDAENIPITKGTETQKAVVCCLNRSFCWFTYIYAILLVQKGEWERRVIWWVERMQQHSNLELHWFKSLYNYIITPCPLLTVCIPNPGTLIDIPVLCEGIYKLSCLLVFALISYMHWSPQFKGKSQYLWLLYECFSHPIYIFVQLWRPELKTVSECSHTNYK